MSEKCKGLLFQIFSSIKCVQNIKIARTCIAFLISGAVFVIVLIKACYSNIWYDEAYTYLYYALPIAENPSLETIIGFWNDSLANNHWLNTLLIAFFTKASHIRYEEIIIRLPNVLFSLVYLYVLAVLFIKKRINILLYTLLSCNYYFVDFMRQARGYGMAAVLVFFGICLMEKWKDEKYQKQLWLVLAFGFFLLSAYANSAALIPLASYGVVALVRLIQQKELGACLKKNWLFMLIYAFFLLVILKYHFMISDIENGKPLFRTNNTSLQFIVKSYLSMIVPDESTPILTIILIVIVIIAIACIVVKTQRFACDHGIALIIYLLCLISMDFIFKRGGLLERTLLPGYPLMVIGIYQLLDCCGKSLFAGNRGKNIKNIITVCFSCFLIAFFIHNVHLLSNGYWKIVEYENYENIDWVNENYDPSEDFYKNKKEWNIQQLRNFEK